MTAFVGRALHQSQGMVAILDALGAKNFTQAQAAQFLDSRQVVTEATNAKAEDSLKDFQSDQLHQFIFNDTVVFAYELPSVRIEDVSAFCHFLRSFEAMSIRRGVLFRGALAIGDFYLIDENENAVMGPVVTDAASWYEQADWVGINATPKATMTIRALLEGSKADLTHILVDYDVPLKNKQTISLKCINWPKGFYVPSIAGILPNPKKDFLQLLSTHEYPPGTESKYFNTVRFFEDIDRAQEMQKRYRVSRPEVTEGFSAPPLTPSTKLSS